MQIIERAKCAISQSEDFELLYNFKEFPIYMGCTTQPRLDDIAADMKWVISKDIGLVQLKELLPLDVLYQKRHDSSTTQHWVHHHQLFAKFLKTYVPNSVFEIGGSYGILSIEYRKVANCKEWVILEPNPAPVEGCNAQFIKGFFDSSFNQPILSDAVVHTNLLEHMYEPDEFIQNISRSINDGTYHIFAHPNMELMLERKYTNCINFEHTLLFTEPYVDYLLAKHGFRILQKEYVLDGHTIFYATVKDSSMQPFQLSQKLYLQNKKMFLDFIEDNEKFIQDVNRKIENENNPVFSFGAHVFTQYFIGFGLNTAFIQGVLDNDSNKHGKRLYGTTLNVFSPNELKKYRAPIVILRAGVHNNAIKSQILQNVNSATIFFE